MPDLLRPLAPLALLVLLATPLAACRGAEPVEGTRHYGYFVASGAARAGDVDVTIAREGDGLRLDTALLTESSRQDAAPLRLGADSLPADYLWPTVPALLGGPAPALCLVARDAPLTLPTALDPALSVTVTARERSGDGAVDVVTLHPAFEGPGNPALTAWCRGPALLVARHGPTWLVRDDARDLARDLGAHDPVTPAAAPPAPIR